MEPRYQCRKEQLLAGCQVPATLFRGVMSRLESFAQPFISSLPSPESRAHSRIYLGYGNDSRQNGPLALGSLPPRR